MILSAAPLAEPDGKTRYLISSIGNYKDEKLERQHVMVNVEITGPIAYKQYCDVELVGRAREARIAHFHGPLSIGPRTILWKVPPKLALKTGENPTDLNAVIGTMDARHGCWVVVCTHVGDKCAFLTGVVPVVDIQFGRESRYRPSAHPIMPHGSTSAGLIFST